MRRNRQITARKMINWEAWGRWAGTDLCMTKFVVCSSGFFAGIATFRPRNWTAAEFYAAAAATGP